MRTRYFLLPLTAFLLFRIASVLAESSPPAAPLVENWINKARSLHLSHETQWLNLVHYRPFVWGGVKSQADGMIFFNAGKEGIHDPEKELEATIRAFLKPAPLDDAHSICIFPARFKWLTSKIGWDTKAFPTPECKKYDEFFSRLQGKSATLIFSSYFMNSPSSTFGHTLIRINKTPQSFTGRRYELLDSGVSYAAVMLSNNPIVYVVSAFAGLFPGSFTSTPYYYKVREYNDFDARDLWEYDLSLTQAEVDMLVAHFWELGNTRFDYFYLTENCSYHMFSAIDAATPRFHLQDQLPYWVIPADTVKIAYNTPKLVSKIHFRPAIRTLFRFRAAGLSSEEQAVLLQLVSQRRIETFLDKLPNERKAAILDAAIDYIDWHYANEILLETGGPMAFKQSLLVARSRIPIQSGEVTIKPSDHEAPHLQHDSARAWISAGSSQQTGNFFRLAHRFALHDLMDPLRGFPETGQIEFLNFVVRHNMRENSWWLEDSNLFSLISVSELDKFNMAKSWRVKFGGRTIRDNVCDNCYALDIQGGPGLGVRLLDAPHIMFAGFFDAEFNSSPKFRGTRFRLRIGPSLMLRTSFSSDIQFMLVAGQKWPILSERSASFETSADLRWAFSRSLAIDAKSSYFTAPRFWEHYAGLMYYY